jgi:hypothetical protein
MPSSLAAALAASKKTSTMAATPKPNDAAKHSAPSSLAQNQKRHVNLQNQEKEKESPVKQASPPNTNDRGSGKQQTPKNKNKKSGEMSPNQRKGIHDNQSAAEEIVFICDIPSSDDDEEIDLDALQINDQQKSSGRGRGGRGRGLNQRGGRDGSVKGNKNNNSGGRVLNVNASRRMIGHALGTRLGPPPNSSDSNDVRSNNNRVSSNPGAMPTPWSKKAQEMRSESNNVNYHADSQCNIDNRRHQSKTSHNQNSREISHQTGGNNDVTACNSLEPAPVAKLESAKIKGRWADEDSSDDE